MVSANRRLSGKCRLKVLSEAVASEWICNVGVLLSDRPTHWAQRFSSGKSLEVLPKVINVSQFSETELDDLLAKHSKTRSDFSPEVLKIIRWPRCQGSAVPSAKGRIDTCRQSES